MVKKIAGSNNSQGFTLIELLIVIVLIGILMVILLSIIDPNIQVNRARDGVVSSSVNKLVLATSSFISAYNRVPNEEEFFHYISEKGNELFGTECSYNLTQDDECLFTLYSTPLPNTCDLSYWTGAPLDIQQCNFRYQGGIMSDSGRYRIYAKSHGLTDTVFVYDNKEGGKLFSCPYDVTDFESLVAVCDSN